MSASSVPTPVVAVLGVGGVGGALAAHLAHAGCRVVCVGRPETAEAIRRTGVRLESPAGVITARPAAVERLDEPVSLLIVAVKAPALAEALERIEAFAVADGIVVPLLNGLEHPDTIRRQLGNRVAPGSISRFEGFREGAAVVVQTTPDPVVSVASDDVPAVELERALQPVGDVGIKVEVTTDERAVLWQKVVRLAPLSAATVASGQSVGALRADERWGSRLRDGVTEACAVAESDGVAVSVSDQLGIIEAMPETLTTSTARDVAAGRPSELDAIAGSVLRAADRLGVAVPALEGLVEEAEDICRARSR